MSVARVRETRGGTLHCTAGFQILCSTPGTAICAPCCSNSVRIRDSLLCDGEGVAAVSRMVCVCRSGPGCGGDQVEGVVDQLFDQGDRERSVEYQGVPVPLVQVVTRDDCAEACASCRRPLGVGRVTVLVDHRSTAGRARRSVPLSRSWRPMRRISASPVRSASGLVWTE